INYGNILSYWKCVGLANSLSLQKNNIMAHKPRSPKNNRKGNAGKSKRGRGKGKKSKKFTPKQIKQAAVDKQVKNPDAGMRLNKYISNSGDCSRQEADIFIAYENVNVNGEVITELGYKGQRTHDIQCDGRLNNA